MVMVDFRIGAVAGVEIVSDGHNVEDPDVGRKEGVERGRGDGKGLRERPCQSGRFVHGLRLRRSGRSREVKGMTKGCL